MCLKGNCWVGLNRFVLQWYNNIMQYMIGWCVGCWNRNLFYHHGTSELIVPAISINLHRERTLNCDLMLGLFFDLHTMYVIFQQFMIRVHLRSVCCTHEVQIDHWLMCLKQRKGNQNHDDDPMKCMKDFAVYLNICIHKSFRFILF